LPSGRLRAPRAIGRRKLTSSDASDELFGDRSLRRLRRGTPHRRYARSAATSPFGLVRSGASLPRRAPPPLWETSRAASCWNTEAHRVRAALMNLRRPERQATSEG